MATSPVSHPFHPLGSTRLEDDDGISIPVICFSHLRWGFTWQRQQHLLTRIANSHAVYVVEEPLIRATDEPPQLLISPDASVTILTPSLPGSRHTKGGFCAANMDAIRQLLTHYFDNQLTGPDVIAWYDTPMALGALPSQLTPSLTIYDVTDELANVRSASTEMHEQERMLMRAANLVFTASPSLYDARKFRHPRAFCFPSGVEASHFKSDAGSRPSDLAQLSSPIIGFFGVLDERIDFDLVAGIADVRPDWSIVMIGPVVKIERARLANRPNIHYLGMKRYEELPRYLAHFDAAMLPLILSEKTQYMSPSKTLEYLAGGKPVVSTALDDVIELYEDVIEIATTPEEFVDAIERLWNESVEGKRQRAGQVDSVLAQNDWDVIVVRMQRLMQDAMNNELTFEKVLREATIRSTRNDTYSTARLGDVAD